jgi:hypothetical protein
MKLPLETHTRHPWRIHEIAPDFRVEDVWAIRTPGAGPDDFPAMLAAIRARGAREKDPLPVRFLFAVRWKLGALLGWDGPERSVGARVPSLCDRLPDELRDTATELGGNMGPLTPVYALDDECVLELANKTVHTLMHLGWTAAANGGHELRMAVLVKPNGLFGRLYMAAIVPFRYTVIYPALTRGWEQAWRERNLPAGGASDAAVESAVGVRRVSESVRKLGSLPRPHYVDHFSLAVKAVEEATPEQWARALFGDVPTPGEKFIWSGLLGIRLSPGRSPQTVAGWRIAGRGEDWVRLEAASWFLSCNLVVRTIGGRVSLTTFVQYDRLLGRLVWTPLSAVHRRLAPGLLRAAAAKLRVG